MNADVRTKNSFSKRIYRALVSLYPDRFLEAHLEELIANFDDLERDTSAFQLWSILLSDFIQSLTQESMESLKRSRQLNGLTVTAALLMLPATLLVATDVLARLIQGDLVHYNRPVYQFLSHTPLYWQPVLFAWAILFPVLAFILSIVSMGKYISRQSVVTKQAFFKQNAFGVLVLVLAMGFIAIVQLHDFVPCVVHSIVSRGVSEFVSIVRVCRKA